MRIVKKLRLEKNMTREELAQKAKVSYSTIYFLETNKDRGFSDNTIRKVAKVLGTTVNAICSNHIEEPLTTKDCLNEGCPLNYCNKCQSEPVALRGEYCQNQHLVTSKQNKIKTRFVINNRSIG